MWNKNLKFNSDISNKDMICLKDLMLSTYASLLLMLIWQDWWPSWQFVGFLLRTDLLKNARHEKHDADPPKCLWVLAKSRNEQI